MKKFIVRLKTGQFYVAKSIISDEYPSARIFTKFGEACTAAKDAMIQAHKEARGIVEAEVYSGYGTNEERREALAYNGIHSGSIQIQVY